MAERYQIPQTLRTTGARAAQSFVASGGSADRAAARAAETATSEVMSHHAKRLARKMRVRRRREQSLAQRKSKVKSKKLTGPMFAIMVSLTLLKDALDIVLTFTVLLSIAIIPITLFISFIIIFYYFYNNVSPSTRKLVTVGLTTVIELLPLLGILPLATVSLFVVKYLENNERAQKFVKRAVA